MNRLCVEGWRFLHHSYAVVNQWQLLALAKRGDIALGIRDVPYFLDHWKSTKGLFAPAQEAVLAALPALGPGDDADVTFRIFVPYDFSPAPRGRTAVFATSEYQCVEPFKFKSPPDIAALSRSGDFTLVTPSAWSREGFLRLGLRTEQIAVVPHGVDADVFRPVERERQAARDMFRLSGFTFANASAMTENKGIDVLLRAFAAVAEKRPDVRLLLKGADGLYESKAMLAQIVDGLPAHTKALVNDRILYFGSTVTMKQMALFYQAVDAYVSPYRAEAFNLPALEAAACGATVICTKGGPTDDFLSGDFAGLIDSRVKTVGGGDTRGNELEPDLDHLIHLMFQAMDDAGWRERARRLGPQHISTHFHWDAVADKLLRAIFP